MNALRRALERLVDFLEEHRVPYMVIGGIANLVWGEPRSTLDIDASVVVEEDTWPAFIRELRQAFRIVPAHPLEFLRDTHVLPVETAEGVRIDLLWVRLPYEHQAVARARLEDVSGCRARVCRPEDLIIHKLIAERPKDREDIRAVVRQQGRRLERAYLLRIARDLSNALDRPDLLAFLKNCLAEARH